MRDFVADVGNSRIKVGCCSPAGLTDTALLPLDDANVWNSSLHTEPARWTLAGSSPEARDRLADWLRARGHAVQLIAQASQIPIEVMVDAPEKVGIDRLLNALAARTPGRPVIIVNAGSAVTVDLVDKTGAFRGGAIMPGYRLMAKALNDYTARLPLVEGFAGDVPLPARDTITAMMAGIGHSVHGGIERMVRELCEKFDNPRILVAGGDAELLDDLGFTFELTGPFLTLEGLRRVVCG